LAVFGVPVSEGSGCVSVEPVEACFTGDVTVLVVTVVVAGVAGVFTGLVVLKDCLGLFMVLMLPIQSLGGPMLPKFRLVPRTVGACRRAGLKMLDCCVKGGGGAGRLIGSGWSVGNFSLRRGSTS